jgi:hypothetical protein
MRENPEKMQDRALGAIFFTAIHRPANFFSSGVLIGQYKKNL